MMYFNYTIMRSLLCCHWAVRRVSRKYNMVQHIVRMQTSDANQKSNCQVNASQRKKLPKDNLSAVMYDVNDLRLEPRPFPKIGPGEVLIAMDTASICGSDLKMFSTGKIGDKDLQRPMVLGQVGSGVIAKVDSTVKELKKGDRVAIEPSVPCYKCSFCRSGRYNLCPNIKYYGIPPHDGIWSRYIKHDANFCYKLPNYLSMEEGALINPLAVAVAACRVAGITFGSDVLIIGSGSIGLMTLIVAQLRGAAKVIVTDKNPETLKAASELGAMHTIVACSQFDDEYLARDIVKRFGAYPNKVINCSGAFGPMGIYAVRWGGCITYTGSHSKIDGPLPITYALSREIDIRGSCRYCNDFVPALRMVSAGKVNVKRLVTHHFPLEEVTEAIETFRDVDQAVKVMIHMQPRDTNNQTPFADPILIDQI